MLQTLAKHKLLLVGIAICVAGLVWYGMSSSSESPASSNLVATPSDVGTNPASQNLVSTLLALRAVKLEGTIFNDPAFMSLKDFSTDLVSEPVGRDNPFAPLSAQATPSENSTKSAQIFTPRPPAQTGR